MKTSIAALSLLLASTTTSAFSPAVPRSPTSSARSMFSGGGNVGDEDPEQLKAMEDAAKSMGMSVEEYKMGVNARMMFEKQIADMRIMGGNDDIGVQVDGRSPPGFLEIKLSEAGKAQGAVAVSEGLKAAFKTTAEGGKKKRAEAQQEMMKYIQENMKA